MAELEFKLFVSRGEESGEAVKILKGAGIDVFVVATYQPYILGPELQIGPSSNNRIRGLEAIKQWLQSQDRKTA